ncbi:helix-turn-helix domain-containing protein [Micromonospora sp. CA-240977]|uniref:RICIN domain-containing protein n=1 Tax=Micromonospora sp. CA-240977 TaxID=3239957 RepID=UPI003D919698
MTTGELRPDEATDPAEFVDMLRRLKDRSRLTYRQLEQRAAATGDVLARSTAADILRRSTLPRPEVVAAFVRACGAEDQVETWLRARHRLAVGAYAPTSPVPDRQPGDGAPADHQVADGTSPADSATADDRPADDRPADGTSPDLRPVDGTRVGRASAARARWFARPVPLALLVGVLLAALGVGSWLQRPDDDGQRSAQLTDPTTSASGSPAATSAGESPAATPEGSADQAIGPQALLSQIRPARSPQLCVSEGHDRTGRYGSQVAVQVPCADATPPDTYVEPAAGGLYHIKWDHPEHGTGCLTVRDEDPGRNLLEPVTKCSGSNPSQLFRFEPTGSAPTSYRIRPTRTDLCVGLRDDDTEVSAEALVEPCTNGPDQVFLIDALRKR